MLRSIRRLFCMVIILALLCPTAFAGVGVYFNTTTQVYQSPSYSSASVTISSGVRVTADAVQSGWARVNANGITAFVPVKYLNFQTRVHGYVSSATRIYSSASTSSYSVGPLPVNTDVYIIGLEGSFFRVQDASGRITGYIPGGCVSPNAQQTQQTMPDPRQYVQIIDWNNGQNLLKKDQYGYIYDIMSSQFIRIKRLYGHNHMDVEPATAEDTMKLYTACGGNYSWDSRPVILIAGGKFVAAAINTMPHGEQTITNNYYNGQFCLHLLNSKTHGSNKVNETHQAAIRYAYKWAHS